MPTIKFLSAKDSGLTYNRTFNYADESFKRNVVIGIRNELFATRGSDTASLTSTIVYKVGDDVLFQFTVEAWYCVEGWNEKLLAVRDDSEVRTWPEVESLIDNTVGYLRGCLGALSQNTPVQGLFLPLFPADKMAEKLNVKIEAPK